MKTHLAAMSFEQKVTELEEVNGAAAISIKSEHILDDIVNFLRSGFPENFSDNGLDLGGLDVLSFCSIRIENNFKLIPKLIP